MSHRALLLLLFTLTGTFWVGRAGPTSSSEPPVDLVIEIDPSEIILSSDIGAVPFEVDDQVPCPEERGEWLLTVEALLEGRPLFRHEQTFCRYDGANVDPRKEYGMRRYAVSHMLTSACCCSMYDYFEDLAIHEVALHLDWNVAHDGGSTDFETTLKAQIDESGRVDLGQGRTLEWTFARIGPRPRF